MPIGVSVKRERGLVVPQFDSSRESTPLDRDPPCILRSCREGRRASADPPEVIGTPSTSCALPGRGRGCEGRRPRAHAAGGLKGGKARAKTISAKEADPRSHGTLHGHDAIKIDAERSVERRRPERPAVDYTARRRV